MQMTAFGIFGLCFILGAPGDNPTPERLRPPETASIRMFRNSTDMEFVLIRAGEFTMGSPESEAHRTQNEGQHRVAITKPFFLGQFEVLKREFAEFVQDAKYLTEAERAEGAGVGYDEVQDKLRRDTKYTWRNTGFTYTGSHPVVNVSWNDAVAFCNWMSRKDGRAEYYIIEGATISTNHNEGYRLPSEAEWEFACRSGTTTAYQSGDDAEKLVAFGNVWDGTARGKHPKWGVAISAHDGYAYTSPAGRFAANAFGLYDMHGNVWEWCNDWHDIYYYETSPADDPRGPVSGRERVYRGGSWISHASECRSATRFGGKPSEWFVSLGFRVAADLSTAQKKSILEATVPMPEEMLRPRKNSAANPGGQRAGDLRDENALKMQFVWCPAGKFVMGSPKSEEGRNERENQVDVTLSHGFWIGKYEVTQRQWEWIMDSAPWDGCSDTRYRPDCPAAHISWHDATAFCARLTSMERKAGRLPAGWRYSLPTEAQWEYACRAGTTTRFSFGDDESRLNDYAWWGGILGEGNTKKEAFAHSVGTKKTNPWGLHDVHGNVLEWCRDAYLEELLGGTDPEISDVDLDALLRGSRVLRGGSWQNSATYCRSALRMGIAAENDGADFGFRVALSPIR